MRDPRETVLGDVRDEVADMLKEGLDHPSTKPVLVAGAAGAVAAAVLPFVSWPLGLVAGAGYMLYRRVRP